MFDELKVWCEQHNYKYEQGRNWCDCVDYTHFANVELKNAYRFTLYLHDNGVYSLNLYCGKDFVASLVNLNELKELTDWLETYEIHD